MKLPTAVLIYTSDKFIWFDSVPPVAVYSFLGWLLPVFELEPGTLVKNFLQNVGGDGRVSEWAAWRKSRMCVWRLEYRE